MRMGQNVIYLDMINRSPWLWGTRKTAAGLTGRTSRGQQILQGKRAKGQSNPSSQYLYSQAAAALIWPFYQKAPDAIKQGYTQIPTGGTAASEFYKYAYKNALGGTTTLDITMDPEALLFTKGVMTPTNQNAAPIADESAKTVVFSWAGGASDATQSELDYMVFVVVNKTTGAEVFVVSDGVVGAQRQAAGTHTYTLNTPVGFMVAGNDVVCYLGAIAKNTESNHGTSSDSTNEIVVVIA